MALSLVRRSGPLVGRFLETVTEELWNAFVKTGVLEGKKTVNYDYRTRELAAVSLSMLRHYAATQIRKPFSGVQGLCSKSMQKNLRRTDRFSLAPMS
jgi:hypothetical protein